MKFSRLSLIASLSLLLIFGSVPFFVHADDENNSPIISVDTPLAKNTKNDKKDEQPAENTATPADTTEPASTTPTTTAAPADNASTTTPAKQDDTPKPAVTQNGDPYDKSIEEVLNEALPPKKPAPAKKATTTVKTTKTASTTPVGGTTNTPSNNDSSAFQRTTDGGSNDVLPNNYYIPLDTLSPETTYALSFLAMILGITGAVMIIRNPREAELWSPQLQQEPLFEP